MHLQTAEERLNQILAPGTSKEQVSAGLDSIVAEVAERVHKAIELGVAGLQEATRAKVDRVERCWQPLASKGLQPILSSKSAAPGLSHHGLYVQELEEAFNESASFEDFRSRIDTLIGKWGSMTRYPLFAKGRRKQLEQLVEGVRHALPAERRRAQERSEKLFGPEREKALQQAGEELGYAAADFQEVISAVLRRSDPPEYVIHLRWLLIQLLQNRLFGLLYGWLGDHQGEHRDLLYLAFEKVLNKIYQSFQIFIGQGTSAGLAVAEITELEILRTNHMIATLETNLSSLKLSAGIAGLIKSRLRSGGYAAAADPHLFVEISSGLHSGHSFDEFVEHLRRLSDLEPHAREEILADIKNTIEPFRSLYYAKINHVRYYKGLKKFQAALPG